MAEIKEITNIKEYKFSLDKGKVKVETTIDKSISNDEFSIGTIKSQLYNINNKIEALNAMEDEFAENEEGETINMNIAKVDGLKEWNARKTEWELFQTKYNELIK